MHQSLRVWLLLFFFVFFVFEGAWFVCLFVGLFFVFLLDFFFIFTPWSFGTNGKIFLIKLFSFYSLDLVFWPLLGNPFISQRPRGILYVSFYRIDPCLYIYYLSIWPNFNNLPQFPVDLLSDPAMPTFVFLWCHSVVVRLLCY